LLEGKNTKKWSANKVSYQFPYFDLVVNEP